MKFIKRVKEKLGGKLSLFKDLKIAWKDIPGVLAVKVEGNGEYSFDNATSKKVKKHYLKIDSVEEFLNRGIKLSYPDVLTPINLSTTCKIGKNAVRMNVIVPRGTFYVRVFDNIIIPKKFKVVWFSDLPVKKSF